MNVPTLHKSRAREIQELHADITHALRRTVDKAIRIGKLLTEQKAECAHGEWLPWLEENVLFSNETARKYMKLYSHRKWLSDGKSQLNWNLQDAYRAIGLLSEGTEQDEPAKQPDSSTETSDGKPEPEKNRDQQNEPEPDVIDAEYTELKTESEVVEEQEDEQVDNQHQAEHTEKDTNRSRAPGLVYEEEAIAIRKLDRVVREHVQEVKKVKKRMGLSEQSLSTIRELQQLLADIGDNK